MRRSSILSLLCGALLCAGSASAAHFYMPFTNVLNTGPSQGIWLADTDNPGNPPFQITNQNLDGPSLTNVAILDDWTYDPVKHLAVDVQPQLIVYGVGGHLFNESLKTVGPVQQFSNGTYGELCGLTALDERPFAAAKAYVQAIVEPVGSPNVCADGVGMQTWLIPANATPATAPVIKPSQWAVLGAFTDPTDGKFVKWIVWTGNEVDAFAANFTTHTTLLVGPPAGPAPSVIGRVDGSALLLSTNVSSGIETDTVYRITATGGSAVSAFTYSTSSPCGAGGFTSSITDPISGQFVFGEPTNSGYAVYTTPLAGGPVTIIYADSTGNECGAIGGDSVSAGFVSLNETDNTLGDQHVIGINETGPSTQAPVLLVGGAANTSAFVHYTINGHDWIDYSVFTGGTTQFSEIVIDADGTLLATYTNSRLSDDRWAGFPPSGGAPGVQRNAVYLASNTGSCAGATMVAIDPATFASTNVNGVPADTCRALAYGWQPLSVGGLTEPAGSSPIEIDPIAGQLYQLLGPQNAGTFTNLASLTGYPFY